MANIIYSDSEYHNQEFDQFYLFKVQLEIKIRTIDIVSNI